MNQPAGPAWSLNGNKLTIDRQNNGQSNCSPGPIYNIASSPHIKSTKTLSKSKSRRTFINQGVQITPSPAYYSPKKSNQDITHSIGFCQSRRVDQEKNNENPEPNRYQINQQIIKKNNGAFSLQARPPSYFDQKIINNPGPASYRIKSQTILSGSLNGKKSKFTTAERFLPQRISPGPGQYETQLKKEKNIKKGTIGKAKRMIDPKNLPPGPNKYFIQRNTSHGSLSKSMMGRRKGYFNGDSETVDAFASYTLQSIHVNTLPSQTFSRQKRKVFQSQDLPGPSDYFPEKPKKQKTHARIPSSKHQQYNQAIYNPAPNQYTYGSPKARSTKFSKSQSVSHLNPILFNNKNPGVGQYKTVKDQIGYNNSKGCKVGKSDRTNFVSKNTVGVGDYDIQKTDMRKSMSKSMGKSERFGKIEQKPGPGEYNIRGTIANHGLYYKKE